MTLTADGIAERLAALRSRPNVPALVKKLQEAGEDFEFYPTTPEIIKCVLDHHYRVLDRWKEMKGTILDVGAGHGAFLKAAAERYPGAQLLAIERSAHLMNELVKFAKVIGTDFHAQTLLTKGVDLLYCNPPYSEYAVWASRLIKECPAHAIYLVIPRRWSEDASVKAAISSRKAKVTTIGSFDFEDAERQARARVDVLHIAVDMEEDELFKAFFFERFGHLQDNMQQSEEQQKATEARTRAGLVEREGLVGALVALYELAMDRLRTNYEKAASIDADVIRELGLSLDAIVSTLKQKLDTLKATYWTELFGCLDTVTKRLTTKNRRAILETIGGFKSVDFTKENIYAVILWIMEHANQYVDAQILAVFDDMIDCANIINYKSNERVFGKGRWRYCDRPKDLSHISLDFRIVIESGWRGMKRGYSGSHLSEGGRDFLQDLHTVATLLGFHCDHEDPRLIENSYGKSSHWTPGGAQLFKTRDGDDLVEVRAFLNGNMHLRLSQKLSLALNVAVGKLRGWLRDHQQAETEFGADAPELFAKDYHMTPKQLMLTLSPQKE